MGRKLEERRKRLERKTARVFFSSPFGGLEEEREELTKKYWPRLESMCNKAGYDFIPVDLRWGITSEMSSSAVTIKVCLNEMDRSDMIVGFFGQRYGWHGDNELLQKSFDVAAEYYPWLNDYRDKSVTELEYLHGHLRNPGARAACFFFRDKAYDDMKLEEAKRTGNEREIRKFIASTDGPHAAELLADLKGRIEQTRDKCLAVHMNYPNPKEGARLMFETIEKYFNEVLLAKPAVKLTEREEENLQHDVFLASRLGMAGNYVGGQKYLDEIDRYLLDQKNDKLNRVLVLGHGGSGKSCMLSNWITLHQMRNPQDIVIYHFVGSTSTGTDPKYIMSRLVDELNEELQDRGVHDASFVSDPKDDMRQLLRKLTGLMLRVKETGCNAFIIIDALNKIEKLGQTMKTLYWLLKDIPPCVYLVVSTIISDSANIKELTERGYRKMHANPLDIKEREEMALTALKKRGKTLSKEQQQRVFSQKQTENPLYLEILLMELVSFGEFFQLDAYIDSLIQANDTKSLFLKYLERLEKDYNPENYHGNLAEEITCCIHLARHGLSENEIRSILGISSQVWSSIFFAMDDFLIERDGLYSFSFNELGEAIEERYFKDNNNKKNEYIGKIADHFEEKLKERSPLYNTTIPSRIYSELPWLLAKLGDKDRLVECILKPAVFYSLKDGLSKYDLIGYWNTAGLSDDEIVVKQQIVIDDQLALFYNDAEEKGEELKTAPDMMIPFVYYLAQFLSDAGRVKAAEPFLERALQMTKALHKIEDIKGDPVIAAKFCDIGNTLACHYVDTEQFDKAEMLHHEVLELKEKFERSSKDGTKSLARTLNGLGVLSFKQSKYQETLNFYQRSLDKHREAHSPQHEIAELLNNIGSVYHALGQWEDAVEKLKESLEIYEEAFFGQLPADVGGTMLNLAMAYRRLDKAEEAEPLYLRALEIRKNAYGENHHEVGQTLLSYSAFLLYDRPEKAAECSKRAAEIYESSMGLDHINTLNALENVALAYLIMQKPAEAHPYFKRAGERKEATDRMDTSIQKLNAVMADYYLNSGQNEEARQLFGRIVKAAFATDRDFAALDFLDSELPAEKRPQRKREHTILYAIEKFPKSAMILGRIQELHSANGNGKEMVQVLKNGEFGVEHYNNAYQAFVKHNHKKEGIALLVAAHEKFPDDKIVMYNLASAHAAYKDYPSASAMFKELLNKDPKDLSTLEAYANVLSLTGRIHEGRDLYNKALKLAEVASDKTAVDRLRSRIKLLNDM